jgi:hypothetical protein
MGEFNRIQQKPQTQPQSDDAARKQGGAKPQVSAFDQVLQQGRVVRPEATVQQQTTKEAAQQQTREKAREKKTDQEGRQRVLRDDDQPVAREKSTQGEQLDRGPKHRVVVKTTGDQGRGGEQKGSGGGGGGGFAGSGGRGTRTKSQIKSEDYSATRSDLGKAVSSKFQQELATKQKVPAALDRNQLQQIVNLLVQSIRVGKNEVGADELALTFHAAIFKGLRLRLEEKDGTVSVNFLSDDGGIRALFSKESGRIAKELKARGVNIGSVQVV